MRQTFDKGHYDEPSPPWFKLVQAAMQRRAFGRANQPRERIGTFVLLFWWLVAWDLPALSADNIQRTVTHEAH